MPGEEIRTTDANPDVEKNAAMTSRRRFLAACAFEPLERPPASIPPHAGPWLPESAELDARHGGFDLARNADLAVEATVVAVRRFGADAATLYGSARALSEALGATTGRGDESLGRSTPAADAAAAAIERVEVTELEERLAPVRAACRLARKALGDEAALVAEVDSPWSLLSEHVGGDAAPGGSGVKALFHARRDAFDRSIERLTEAACRHADLLTDGGADALRILDSRGRVLDTRSYWYASAQWIERMVRHVDGRVPVLLSATGCHAWLPDLLRTGAPVVGVDWTIPIARFHDRLGGTRAVEGNLDPAFLGTTPEIVREETERILDDVGRRRGLVFGLGGEILPGARTECLDALFATVRDWRPTDDAPPGPEPQAR